MNDKNFIEELRKKREEYGVTQIKIADMSKGKADDNRLWAIFQREQ